MQTQLIKISAIILTASLLCSLFSGCSKNNPSPTDTIETLENAINSVDVESILRCLDSTWAEQLESILSLSVGEGGVSVERFLSIVKTVLPVLPFLSKGTIQTKNLPKVKLTVIQIKSDEDYAEVSVSGTFTWAGLSKSFSTIVPMQFEDDMWVICAAQ